MPEAFSVDRSDRLGLQIVRTLVEAELGASLELAGRGPDQPGTAVTLRVPVNRRERARGSEGSGGVGGLRPSGPGLGRCDA